MKDELLRLAAICEKADGRSDEIERAICESCGLVERVAPVDASGVGVPRWPPVMSSIDAALTLVPEGLVWSVDGPDSSKARVTKLLDGHTFTVLAATPALALCAASLRARASMENPQ